MNNAQSAIRATVATGATWLCKAWNRAKKDICNAQNLMIRWNCYSCGYPIRPWDWMDAAVKQGFDMKTQGVDQNALMRKNQNLRGGRAGRDEKMRSRKVEEKAEKKVVIILIDHHFVIR